MTLSNPSTVLAPLTLVWLSACGGQAQPDAAAPTGAAVTAAAPPPAPPSPPVASTVPSAPVAPTKAGDGRRYTMADLEALASSQSWSELLAHAEDVRPTERNDTWRSLLVLATTRTIEADRKADRNRDELAVALEAFLDRYPALRESRELAPLRGSVMVEGVDKCTAENSFFDPCLWFATAFAGDPAHAQAAGDAAAKHGHRGLALKLYRVAANLDARTLCQDDAALAVVAELRAGHGESPNVANAEAIHASCEQAKKQR